MGNFEIIQEAELDAWVEAHPDEAPKTIVELVGLLVAASIPRPLKRRFSKETNQPGPDGHLVTDDDFNPFIPEGVSYWEIGTNGDAQDKATRDYADSLSDIAPADRKESTFIFVTPRSARRSWKYTWKKNGQNKWIEKRLSSGEWKDIRILDASLLVDWISQFPAVSKWLSRKMGKPCKHVETLDEYWRALSEIGSPPPLSSSLFTKGRAKAIEKLNSLLNGEIQQLRLDTHYPDQAIDFVSAHFSSLDVERQTELLGRSIVISNAEVWDDLIETVEKLTLIVNFDLDGPGASGAKLLSKAQRKGHSVIYTGVPGGPYEVNRADVPNPRNSEIYDGLVASGYLEERARNISQRSDGNLGTLLRCLQSLSRMPAWANVSPSGELTIAGLLGQWDETREPDKKAIEDISGKTYGEWIGKIKEIYSKPDAPLIFREEKWKFSARYEGWFALGPRLFEDQLQSFCKIARRVLRESDPQFDLEKEERYRSEILGKTFTHSRLLRKGIAETLALVGSLPAALTNFTPGQAERIASDTIRDILDTDDWKQWASLNDVMPHLAEAAPNEFLHALEKILSDKSSIFLSIWEQEGDGWMSGGSHMTGLLWALELLAWSDVYLARVVLILGKLASLDLGGKWTNRPANSLIEILLPWYPQTCAPVIKRIEAVNSLIKEHQNIGWKLILGLLPNVHQTSSGTYKPIWRKLIPDTWEPGATHLEEKEQYDAYSSIALTLAKNDLLLFLELLDHIENISGATLNDLLEHVSSSSASYSQEQQASIWAALTNTSIKHRKYSDADWAFTPEWIGKIELAAQKIKPSSPSLKFQILFNDRDYDHFEEKGNYEQQRKALEKKRTHAAEEIHSDAGFDGLLEFAKSIDSPWIFGLAVGSSKIGGIDRQMLPDFLSDEKNDLSLFASGFIWARYWEKGWSWCETLDLKNWPPLNVGQFLAKLPFKEEVWSQVPILLPNDESLYWARAIVNPYFDEKKLHRAAEKLLEHNRVIDAIECLSHLTQRHENISSSFAFSCLNRLLTESAANRKIDAHDIAEIIEAVQKDPAVNGDDLLKLEWNYLPVLERQQSFFPKTIIERINENPDFFAEIIKLGYRSQLEIESPELPIDEERKSAAKRVWTIFHVWHGVPGTMVGGTLDESLFVNWIKKALKLSQESGHLDIAKVRIGHLLRYCPADPSGLWIHKAAANLLNDPSATDMLNGYCCEWFNSRGVHGFSHGAEEAALAKTFNEKAEAVESAGYVRFATALRNFATSYAKDAARESIRTPFDDF